MKPAVVNRVFTFCLTILLASPALAAETVRYLVLVDGGKQAGHQWVTRGDDGVTRVDYIFKDNGRGPELKEEFTLADDGTFVTYHVKGTSTFGAPIDESFTRTGDLAKWQSTSDKGEKKVSGTALYTPLGGTPAGFSAAFAALAKRADGKLPLIPSGTLTSRKLAEAEVTRGNDKRKVQLIAMTGVGFTPTFAWTTTDASPRLFAFIFPGFLQALGIKPFAEPVRVLNQVR